MSEDVYKMFGSQYSKKVSLLSQQTGERYGKKKSTRNTKASKTKRKRPGRHSKTHKTKKFSRGQGKPL
jgi:hypothetical protein